MAESESTCWTVIKAAAAGSSMDREEFIRRYDSVVRGYLAARWQGTPFVQHLDDAAQETFLECFRPCGVLQRVDDARQFRPFFYGVIRHVAQRVERDHRRQPQVSADVNWEDLADDDESLSKVFDRIWARALLREAARVMEQHARNSNDGALRRVDLLRLRFQEDLPIRDIATRWGVDARWLHHEYAKARHEFKAALREAVAFHCPKGWDAVEQECANLLSFLR